MKLEILGSENTSDLNGVCPSMCVWMFFIERYPHSIDESDKIRGVWKCQCIAVLTFFYNTVSKSLCSVQTL